MSSFIRNPHLDGETFFWQGNSTGVLLLHGFTATTAEVRLLGEYLRERGYTVSAPLLPGHGTTPAEMNGCQWQDWTNAVERAYQELAARCDRVFVCGESMGAVLALYLASDHPEIAGICAFAPALLVPRLRILLAQGLSLFVSYVRKPVKKKPDATDPRWKGYSVNPLRAVTQLDALQRATRRRLTRIHQPILVLQGRLDQTIDPRGGNVILDGVSSSAKEIHWLENSTHCVILDCEWEKAAELTVEFIGD